MCLEVKFHNFKKDLIMENQQFYIYFNKVLKSFKKMGGFFPSEKKDKINFNQINLYIVPSIFKHFPCYT